MHVFWPGRNRALSPPRAEISVSARRQGAVLPSNFNISLISPELKAQVSFSDRLLSAVCLSVCKLFTFSSSSQKPLGQFQPNLAKSILGWWEIMFVQMKGQIIFSRTKLTVVQSILGCWGFNFRWIKTIQFSKRRLCLLSLLINIVV